MIPTHRRRWPGRAFAVVAVAIVVLFTGMGLAYGMWYEALVVNGAVNTGDLKVIITDVKGWDFVKPKHGGAQLLDLAISDDRRTLTISLGNMFPGAEYEVQWLKWENIGTIPAKIQSVTITTNDPANIGYVEWKQLSPLKIHRADGGPTVKLGKFDYTPINEVPEKFYDMLAGYVLFPGDELGFDAEEPEEGCFRIRLSPDAPNESQDKTITFSLVFTWTQFNAP